MNGVDPRGLDSQIRQKALEWIKKHLNGLARASYNPTVLDSLDSTARKFEESVFAKATTKDDYIYRIKRRVAEVITRSPAAFTAGNNVGTNVILRPVTQSNSVEQNSGRSFLVEQNPDMLQSQYQASQMHIPARSPTVQPITMAGQQNPQFGHQDSQFGHQNQQFIQQNQQFGQQNVQFGEQNQQFRQHSQQLMQQDVIQRDIRNPFAEHNILKETEMSSAYFCSQSQMPSTTVSSALSSFSDTENTNSAQLQHLVLQFRQVKSSYLLEFNKCLQILVGKFRQAAQTVSDKDYLKKHIDTTQQMIKFLSFPEDRLLIDIQKLRYNLNAVIKYYGTVKNVVTSAMNQAQNTQRLVSTNVTHNTMSAPTLLNQQQPVVSSSTHNPGFSNGSLSSTEQMDVKSNIMHLVAQGSADRNTNHNMKMDHSSGKAQHLEMLQSVLKLPEKRKLPIDSFSMPGTINTASNMPEMKHDLTNSMSNPATNIISKLLKKENDPTDSTSKSTTNATSRVSKRVSKKPCSKPRAQSSENSHDAWLNLVNRSKKRRIPSKLSQCSSANTPSTPVTPSSSTPIAPSSLPKENEDIETITETSNLKEQPKLVDQTPLLGTPEMFSCSPIVSDCTDLGLEATQQPSEKQPIDRLMDAVKLGSKETLASAVNDMRSAIIEMDELPASAYLEDRFEPPPFGDDFADFVESMYYESMDDEGDQHPVQQPPKLKRYIESISRDASFPPNNPDCTHSSKLEANQTLLHEIKDANHMLFGTVVKVEPDSGNQSNGTIVRCTYSPIAVSSDILRTMFASESINLSIEFLVPFDYPNWPPKILDCKLPDFGIAIEMAKRAKTLFDSQVQCVDPLRVGEMAQVWDLCARSIFVAYAKLFGAETLSSKFGEWESIQVNQ